MNVLVTGGAGYIGSHATKRLLAAGHRVVVIDNLDRGHRQAVNKDATLEKLDLRQTDAVTEVLRKHNIECVMHFAALAYVGESVNDALRYYDNNVHGSISLLSAMCAAEVKRLVFSSTCATYGEPQQMPIIETQSQSPINPYGWSKLMVERVLIDHTAANPDFAFAAPRYFNVAGCATDGAIGEDHDPETHLVPVILRAALGKIPAVTIYGDDYPTDDGTCVRDYVHVEDLVDAHIVLMNSLKPGDQRFYNLGIGQGYSVKQIVEAAKKVTGVNFTVKMGPRRSGDPPQLYADPSKIRNELGWQAKITDVHDVIETAWRWFKQHPDGYR